MWFRRTFLILLMLMLTPVLVAQATTTYPTPDFTESLIIPLDSINRPTNFAIAPDGRIFITLQGDAAHSGGAVLVYENGALLPDPLIVVPTNYQNEHGL